MGLINPSAGGGGAEALEDSHIVGNSGQPAYEYGWGALTAGGTRFYKDRGRVFIYISAFNAAAVGGEWVFTLPVGYRPVQPIYFYEFFQFITRRWKVQTDGAVVYDGSNGVITSEIGVDFRLA